MSDPIFPLRQWPSGIQQASVPANDNALREEAVKRPALGVANDASGSDADGDMWIVGDTPAGAFATFEENDVALYQFGSWYAWAPTDGLRLIVNDVPKIYVGGSTNEWQDDTSDGIPDAPSDGTGYVRKDGAWAAESGGGGSDDLTLVTEASAFTAVPATHSGRSKLILAGGDVTFDDAETYVAGNVFNIRATAAIDLVEDGVTLTPPAGGTLALDADCTVTVAMTGATTGVVIGQTVAAP